MMRGAKSTGDLLAPQMQEKNRTHSDDDISRERPGADTSTFPISFHWRHSGNDVKVHGSWTTPPWTVPIALAPASESGSDVQSVNVMLPVGIHSYKFVVDGEWLTADEQPVLADMNGNINNCISVTRTHAAEAIPEHWSPSHQRKRSSGHGHLGKLLHAQLLLPGVREIATKKQAAEGGSSSRKFLSSSITPTRALGSSAEDASTPDRDVVHKDEAHDASVRSSGSASEDDGEKEMPQQSASAGATRPRAAEQLNTSGISQYLSHFVDGGATDLDNPHRLLLSMVGLPARGKSFIARKLARYLNWLGFRSKVFNLGSYRRKKLGKFHSQGFFHPDNPKGMQAREKMARMALDDLIKWYREDDGHVAIYDGTNSTVARREFILNRVKEERPTLYIKTIFVEIICNDPDVIETNIRATKLSSPDYEGMDPEEAVKDFVARIENYKLSYQTLGVHDNHRYIKIFDVGQQIVGNRINGFMPGRVLFYLNNLHIIPREIYLCRHGQSQYNVLDKLGGDSPLTEMGLQFAEKLEEFMTSQMDCEKDLCVWSSTMQRAVQTSENLTCVQYVRWRAMEEIQVGVCDGMSYEEVEEKMPDEFAARKRDKLRYRYPRGESYEDLIRRLDPVIIELERQRKPILIVAHRAVLRCLYAYFSGEHERERVPHISIPLHTVIKLTPKAYGTAEERFKLMPGDD